MVWFGLVRFGLFCFGNGFINCLASDLLLYHFQGTDNLREVIPVVVLFCFLFVCLLPKSAIVNFWDKRQEILNPISTASEA